jgi:hypothetical protein
MRPGAIVLVLAAAAAAATVACGEEAASPRDAASDATGPIDAAGDAPIDAPAAACPSLDETSCLARADCHAAYAVMPCRNILGYCAEYQRCDAGAADCLGPALCDIPSPFCAGPYVNSYVGACYGACVRADQCAGCRADKMTFTQANGCANDGSVEFCVPPVIEHALMLIAPTVHCAVGVGRAGCDPGSQLLCSFPTDATTCTAPHGGLTDAAWDTLCGVSMLPDVERIVPTIFE